MSEIDHQVVPVNPVKDFLGEVDTPIPLEPTSLDSKKVYRCHKHPTKEAFCQCVKCGNFLCNDCGILILGRRYCEPCIIEDEQLQKSLFYEQNIPRLIQNVMQRQAFRAPQKISDLPAAMISLAKDGTVFFANAKDTPFHVSFLVAFGAIVPNTIAVSIKNFYHFFLEPTDFSNFIQTLAQQNPVWGNISFAELDQIKQFYEMVQGISHAPIMIGLIILSIIVTMVKIFLLDLIYWGCIRAFTANKMKYKEAANILHFCLFPLVLCVFATIFDLQLFYYIAFVLMLFQATAASRISTQCTFLQGMGVIVLFVTFSTILGLLG